MKRFAKIAILFCVCIAALVGVAACSSVTGISVDAKQNTALQRTFVRGEELDLSGGVITVTTKDGTEFVSLTAEEVTVTGYDSQTLGKQTLTVTYGGKTATFDITVVPRISAVNYTSEYFVGDSFNKDKGTLYIYRNDGNYFTVDMSDESVSVSGFNSSAAGESEVTLTYKSDTEEYSDTITATVYEVADISIKKPNKISYKSHETALDLSGGYITLTNEGKSYSKSISLTDDMVSGFDLSVATYENSRNTEISQTLTISYGGKTTSFNISISYSDVSVIQDCAESFASLDWSNIIPNITTEQGELAIDALGLFDTLSSEDKEYIDSSVYIEIARVAAVYGLSHLKTVADSNRAVIQYNDGEYEFVTCGYEDAKADYANLSASAVMNVADQLTYIRKNYGNSILYKNITFSSYLSMVPGYVDSVTLLGQLLGYYESFTATYLPVSQGSGDYSYDSASGTYVNVGSGNGNYTLEEGIPSDWTPDTLSNYYKTIVSVYSDIVYGDYFSSEYRSAYALLNEWRSDFFTILYNYWSNNSSAVINLSVIYITYPFDEIEELTSLIYTECSYIYASLYYASSGYSYSYDASIFLYYYNQYLYYIDMAANSTGTVAQILYEVLPIIVTISDGSYISYTISEWLEFFTYQTWGYNGRTYFFTGFDAVEDLWNDYLEMMTLYIEAYDAGGFNIRTFATSADVGPKIASMFEKFVALTPAEQNSFLSAINSSYTYGAPYQALDLSSSSSVNNYFAYFIYYYYRANLDDEEFDLFCDLLCALEYYERQYETSLLSGVMSYFLYYMDSAVAAYTEMSGFDENGNEILNPHGIDNFNNYLDFLYTKYLAIYNLYDENGNYVGATDLGDWQTSFDELATYLSQTYTAAYEYVYTNGNAYYSAIYAAYEAADEVAQNIISNAPEYVVNAYYYMPVTISVGTNTVSWSLDYALSYMQKYYGYYMSFTVVDGQTLTEVYKTSGLRDFFIDTNYLFGVYLNYGQTTAYDSSTVLSLMSEFRSLTAEQRALFIEIDTTGTMHYADSLYYMALSDFFADSLSSAAAAAADWLMRAELAYVLYEENPDGIDVDGSLTRTSFKTNIEYAISAYEALSDFDKLAFDALLGDIYTVYYNAYTAL